MKPPADTDYDFRMNGITEKDWAKIFLHLQVHQKGIKTVRSSEFGVTLELDLKYIITYLPSKLEILVSTHPKNIPKLKEMLYHYMNCSCKIDAAINNSNTFAEALKSLGVEKHA